MAWIEYHTALRDHWKIKRLADLMGVNYNEALGSISCLWLWCVLYAPDGDVTRFSGDELRHAANTNNEKFTPEALKTCELIDSRNRINDWGQHGVKYLKSARLRTKKYRERLRNSHVTVTPTIPDHTIPNQYIGSDAKKRPPFRPPTPEEAAQYAKSIGFVLDGEKFVNHYAAAGWMRGKTKITNWKACIVTWKRNGTELKKEPEEWEKKILSHQREMVASSQR